MTYPCKVYDKCGAKSMTYPCKVYDISGLNRLHRSGSSGSINKYINKYINKVL